MHLNIVQNPDFLLCVCVYMCIKAIASPLFNSNYNIAGAQLNE